MRALPWFIVSICWLFAFRASPGLETSIMALTATIESCIALWFAWQFWQHDADPARIRWDGKVLAQREATRKANRKKPRLSAPARLRSMGNTAPGAL